MRVPDDYMSDSTPSSNIRIAFLVKKYIFEQLSDAEKEDLMAWVNKNENNKRIFLKQTSKKVILNNFRFSETNVSKKHKKMQDVLFSRPGRLAKLQPKYLVVAAAAFALIVFASYFLLFKGEKATISHVASKTPAGKQSVSSVTPGNNPVAKAGSDQNSINTDDTSIVTRRGESHFVVLPDDTHVWLNAVSSIRYPKSFTGNERRVSVTGEAYFEVAKDPSKPFIVDLFEKGNSIRVLGTHFNINAYPDEKISRITLLEGSLKVISNRTKKEILLKPSYQVVIPDTGPAQLEKHADTSAAIAWKDEVMTFKDANVDMVMREIARHYDVQIMRTGKVSNHTFTCSFSRTETLENMINILKSSGIPIKMDGKNLMIGD